MRQFLAIATLFIWGILAGCVIFESLMSSSPYVVSTFNHKVHVEKEKMECKDCHGEVKDAEQPKKPKLSDCEDCHDESNQPAKYKELVQKRKKGTSDVQWLPLPATFGDVIFSHKTHLGSKKATLKCENCHGKIGSSDSILSSVIPTMSGCLECHEKEKVKPSEDNCAGCHKETRKDKAPKSHEKMWKKLHGDQFKMNKKPCFYCHNETTCVTCHMTDKPESHNEQWLHGGHGYTAEVDRETCELCHTQDSCVRCHQSTPPRNHRSNWGRSAYFHCNNCHFPLSDNSCRACHSSTPSHASAPQLPSTVAAHSFSTNCLQCHPSVVAINHPYTLSSSAECLNCHRRP